MDNHTARAYALPEDPSTCVVAIFKEYISRCPDDILKKALYIYPLQRWHGELWFGRSIIGHNALSDMTKKMMQEGGYDGYYTNHSLRVTTVTRLFDENVDTKLIQNQTGHRSSAVDGYKRVSDVQQQNVSKILQGKRQKTIHSVTSTAGEVSYNVLNDENNNIAANNPEHCVYNIAGDLNIYMG